MFVFSVLSPKLLNDSFRGLFLEARSRLHLPMCSVRSNSLQKTPVSYQNPQSMEFSKEDVRSLLPTPGIFPIQRSNPCLLHLLCWWADSWPLKHWGFECITLSYPGFWCSNFIQPNRRYQCQLNWECLY